MSDGDDADSMPEILPLFPGGAYADAAKRCQIRRGKGSAPNLDEHTGSLRMAISSISLFF